MSAVEDRRRVLASFGRRAGPLFKLAQRLQVSATKTYACKVRPFRTRSHCEKSVASFLRVRVRAVRSDGRSVASRTGEKKVITAPSAPSVTARARSRPKPSQAQCQSGTHPQDLLPRRASARLRGFTERAGGDRGSERRQGWRCSCRWRPGPSRGRPSGGRAGPRCGCSSCRSSRKRRSG